MGDLATLERSKFIEILSSLKSYSVDELMNYYEKCLRFLKNQSDSSDDMTYYIFFMRDYIECILSEADSSTFDSEIRLMANAFGKD